MYASRESSGACGSGACSNGTAAAPPAPQWPRAHAEQMGAPTQLAQSSGVGAPHAAHAGSSGAGNADMTRLSQISCSRRPAQVLASGAAAQQMFIATALRIHKKIVGIDASAPRRAPQKTEKNRAQCCAALAVMWLSSGDAGAELRGVQTRLEKEKAEVR